MATTTVKAMEWNVKVEVIKTVMECGGKVFGGAVRDMILHNKSASRFYEAHADKPSQELYADKEYYPEFADRLVIPVDIDATIDCDNLDKFISNLVNKNYSIKRIFSRDAKSYLPSLEVDEGEVRHNRYKVTPVKPQLASILTRELLSRIPREIKMLLSRKHEIHGMLDDVITEIVGPCPEPFLMDVMVTDPTKDTMEAPFGGLDFECNGLILDGGNIRMSDCLLQQLRTKYERGYEAVSKWDKTTQIMEDIVARRAVWCGGFAQEYRIKHMQDKNWTITGFNLIKRMDDAYDGHCIICHDDCKEQHYKRTCCDARYHPKCLINTLSRPRTRVECPMCKKHFRHEINLDSDFVLLRGITEEEPIKTDEI
jgi:hypothetical protein